MVLEDDVLLRSLGDMRGFGHTDLHGLTRIIVFLVTNLRI